MVYLLPLQLIVKAGLYVASDLQPVLEEELTAAP